MNKQDMKGNRPQFALALTSPLSFTEASFTAVPVSSGALLVIAIVQLFTMLQNSV